MPEAPATSVAGLVQPHELPRLIVSSNSTEPAPSVAEPSTSKRTLSCLSVSGSNRIDTNAPMTQSGACTRKITRQPKISTSGVPATTPMTGAPAVTKPQYPSGRTRSSARNILLMYAIAAGPVAEPAAADNVRNTISEGAFHAKALSNANTPAKNNP